MHKSIVVLYSNTAGSLVSSYTLAELLVLHWLQERSYIQLDESISTRTYYSAIRIRLAIGHVVLLPQRGAVCLFTHHVPVRDASWQ